MIQSFRDTRASRLRRRKTDNLILPLVLAVAGFGAAFGMVIFSNH
jgi:hypothetical protein